MRMKFYLLNSEPGQHFYLFQTVQFCNNGEAVLDKTTVRSVTSLPSPVI